MVIVITGPIASGKSTVALELARELERTQVRLAVIDLDLVYDSITPTKSRPVMPGRSPATRRRPRPTRSWTRASPS